MGYGETPLGAPDPAPDAFEGESWGAGPFTLGPLRPLTWGRLVSAGWGPRLPAPPWGRRGCRGPWTDRSIRTSLAYTAVSVYTNGTVFATDTDITFVAVTEETTPLEFLWDFGEGPAVRTASRSIKKRLSTPRWLVNGRRDGRLLTVWPWLRVQLPLHEP